MATIDRDQPETLLPEDDEAPEDAPLRSEGERDEDGADVSCDGGFVRL